jgi:hypothetical protein
MQKLSIVLLDSTLYLEFFRLLHINYNLISFLLGTILDRLTSSFPSPHLLPHLSLLLPLLSLFYPQLPKEQQLKLRQKIRLSFDLRSKLLYSSDPLINSLVKLSHILT